MSETDLISRQAAIDALGKDPSFKVKLFGKSYDEGRSDQWFKDVHALTTLPSAQPRTGHWIFHDDIKNVYGGTCIECSECGEKYVVRYVSDEKFCRNCGAKNEAMRND